MVSWKIQNNMHKYPLEDLTIDEKSTLHKCSKVITYMKIFIPSDCTIFSNPITTTNYNEWLNDLNNLCHDTAELVMKFLDDNCFEKNGTNLNPIIKHKARFEATYKMLESIPKNEFPYPEMFVSDTIFTQETSLHPYYANIHQWATNKKSKR